MSAEIEEMMQRVSGTTMRGRLAEAEPLYRQVLELNPNQVDALHLLGVIAHQVKRYDLAVQYITARDPTATRCGGFLYQFGKCLSGMGAQPAGVGMLSTGGGHGAGECGVAE